MKIGVMVVDLEAQGVFVDIDVVPYLLGGLVVDVGRRSGGSRTRDGPRGERGLGLIGVVSECDYRSLELGEDPEGLGTRWRTGLISVVWVGVVGWGSWEKRVQ